MPQSGGASYIAPSNRQVIDLGLQGARPPESETEVQCEQPQGVNRMQCGRVGVGYLREGAVSSLQRLFKLGWVEGLKKCSVTNIH